MNIEKKLKRLTQRMARQNLDSVMLEILLKSFAETIANAITEIAVDASHEACCACQDILGNETNINEMSDTLLDFITDYVQAQLPEIVKNIST